MKLKPSALVLLGLAMLLYAQSPSNGNITISGSTCATTNACVIAILPANAATATIDISGTYSGTLQFEGVGTTGTVASLSCTPIGTSTPATSTTSTGVWQCPVSGLAKAQVRGSSFSSGTAVVGINPSSAGAGAGKVVGGVSGLTPGTIPKAATATTLTNSVLSESAGALTATGAINAASFRATDTGTYADMSAGALGLVIADQTSSAAVQFSNNTGSSDLLLNGTGTAATSFLTLPSSWIFRANSKALVLTSSGSTSSDYIVLAPGDSTFASEMMRATPAAIKFGTPVTPGNTASDQPVSITAAGIVTTSKSVKAQRIFANQGTAVVAGDIALSAGWGTGKSVGTVSGFDQALTFVVTSGTTNSANPTITFTFKDGTFTTVPVCLIQQTGGNDAYADIAVTQSATAPVFTWLATPAESKTFTFSVICMGR